MTPPAAAAAPGVRPRRAPVPAPARAPRRPRRISGPARPAAPTRRRPAARSANVPRGLVAGLLAAFEALAQHRLLDRLIRGRVWIGLVAFALIGIVTLQLGLLKLNGAIGRAIEHEALLQRENAALSIENSELAAGTRVESSAAKLGMSFAPVSDLRFLRASPRHDAAKAAAALATAAQAATRAREASSAEAQAPAAGEAGAGEGEGAAASVAGGEAGGGEASSAAAAATEAEASGEGAPAGSAEAAGEGEGEGEGAAAAVGEAGASEAPSG